MTNQVCFVESVDYNLNLSVRVMFLLPYFSCSTVTIPSDHTRLRALFDTDPTSGPTVAWGQSAPGTVMCVLRTVDVAAPLANNNFINWIFQDVQEPEVSPSYTYALEIWTLCFLWLCAVPCFRDTVFKFHILGLLMQPYRGKFTTVHSPPPPIHIRPDHIIILLSMYSSLAWILLDHQSTSSCSANLHSIQSPPLSTWACSNKYWSASICSTPSDALVTSHDIPCRIVIGIENQSFLLWTNRYF